MIYSITKFLLRASAVVWIMVLLNLIFGTGAASANVEAGGPSVTVCHLGKNMMVNSNSLTAHLRHGDTPGKCQSEVDLPPSAPPAATDAHPLYRMWLLTRDLRITNEDGSTTIYPAYWQCLIRSETHPSIERQGALCFSDQFRGTWFADNAPCAAPVMSDGSWACDRLTSWRIR